MKKHFEKIIDAIPAIYFFVMIIITQVVMYTYIYHRPFPRYFFLDLFIIIVLCAPLLIKNKKIIIIYSSIVGSIVPLISLITINFYLIFGCVFTLNNLKLLSAGAQVFDFSYINVGSFILYFIFIALIIAGEVLFQKRLDKRKREMIFERKVEVKKHFSLANIIACLSIGAYAISYAAVYNYEVKHNGILIAENPYIFRNSNFQKYGMFSFFNKEIEYSSNYSKQEEIDDLIEYFLPRDYQVNEYTGTLQNYNVINIMIETGTTRMINETLTPNLYKLINEGVYCSNNYSKNKTNISELIGINGSATSLSVLKNDDDLYFPFSLPRLIPDNYNKYYFHDVGGDKDIYFRKELFPNFGFDKLFFHDEIRPGEEMWNWDGSYGLDSITMKNVAEEIAKDTSKPFYAHYTSLAMHGKYDNRANQPLLNELYLEELLDAKAKGLYVNPLEEREDLAGSTSIECFDTFMMCAMDFDVGLGLMIDKFKEKGIYDNTLFVLYGDHELYYNDSDVPPHRLNFLLAGYEESDFKHADIYKTVLTFSNPRLNALYRLNNNVNNSLYTQFTSPYNIVPTILDLLGIRYNTKMYPGYSLFSKNMKNAQAFFSCELASIFNDKYWTEFSMDENTGEIISKLSTAQDDSEIDKTSQDYKEFINEAHTILEKQVRLDLIYERNLFADSRLCEILGYDKR